MKFYPLIKSNRSPENLSEEYQHGYKLGSLRLGENYLFFRSGFSTYFILYKDVYRFYRRIKLIPARMCCTRMDLEIEYLVLCDKNKELAEIQLPSKRAAKILMERLRLLMPKAKVGIEKEKQKRIKKELEVTS